MRFRVLAPQEYDFVVLGTGLKECILSGLLSVNKYKVLHLDRNGYYGAESASLNLTELFKKYEGTDKVPETLNLGQSRNWMVDQCPKLLMACGEMVKILLSTGVTRYLEFKSIEGSFVYMGKGKITKVPSSGMDALKSPLLGMWDKYRFKTFIDFVQKYDQKKVETWPNKLDCTKTPMAEVYKYFKLNDNIQEFIGHAVCLQIDDSYKTRPAIETIKRARLYAYSVNQYGLSPYIYPVWGLGGLPEGFSRLSAVHGGTYMLNKEFKGLERDESGKVTGVKSTNEEGKDATARAKLGVLADPTYFLDSKGQCQGGEVEQKGQVAKWICILDHPIQQTKDVPSCQIIMPGSKVGRKSDVYISLVSYSHKVAQRPYYIATISALCDSTDENAVKAELKQARQLLGRAKKEFFSISPYYVPNESKLQGSKLVVSESYDATTHWETTCAEVQRLFTKLTGKTLDLSASLKETMDKLQEEPQ